MQTLTFDSILDAIENLSVDEQTNLLTIMHRRLSDRRRAEIAANIAQGKQDYQSGNVFRGTVDEAIAELNSWKLSLLLHRLNVATKPSSANTAAKLSGDRRRLDG